MSEYNKTKLREAVKGKPRSAEFCRKVSEAKKGCPGFFKGKHHTEESKAKLRQAGLLRRHSEETKAKMSKTRKGKKLGPQSEEHRRKLGDIRRGRKMSEEHRRKTSIANKGKIVSTETKLKVSEAMKAQWAAGTFDNNIGSKRSAETKNKQSESMKNLYHKDPDFHRRVRQGQMNTLKKKRQCPNSCERQLGSLLDKLFPGEYKFVGDGTFTVGNLNPDFVNVNGQKKVIEFFGELWHDPKIALLPVPHQGTEEGRKQIFNEYGFKALVVWGKDLKTKNLNQLESKLVEFHQS